MKVQSIPFLPHPPELFHPQEEDKEVLDTYQQLVDQVVFEEPQALVFLQSHGGLHPDGVTFQMPSSDEGYHLELSHWNVAEDPQLIPFDRELASQIQKSLMDYEKKQQLLPVDFLSHPVALFLSCWQKRTAKVPPCVVIAPSLEGAQQHYEYGSLIQRALASDTQEIAVIATGQLAHTLSKESEAGYVPSAYEYDMQSRELLKSAKWQDYLNTDPFVIQEVGEDFFRVMCMALGMLNALSGPIEWEEIAYQAPKGIGYLSGRLTAL